MMFPTRNGACAFARCWRSCTFSLSTEDGTSPRAAGAPQQKTKLDRGPAVDQPSASLQLHAADQTRTQRSSDNVENQHSSSCAADDNGSFTSVIPNPQSEPVGNGSICTNGDQQQVLIPELTNFVADLQAAFPESAKEFDQFSPCVGVPRQATCSLQLFESLCTDYICFNEERRKTGVQLAAAALNATAEKLPSELLETQYVAMVQRLAEDHSTVVGCLCPSVKHSIPLFARSPEVGFSHHFLQPFPRFEHRSPRRSMLRSQVVCSCCCRPTGYL